MPSFLIHRTIVGQSVIPTLLGDIQQMKNEQKKMSFHHIDTDTKLQTAKKILEVFMADLDMYLVEHRSENKFLSDLNPELQDRINSSLNTMIHELEEIKK